MSIAYMVMQGEYYPQAILFSVIFELLGVKANAFVTFPIIPEYMFCLQAGAFTAFRIQPPWKCNMAAVKPEITPPPSVSPLLWYLEDRNSNGYPMFSGVKELNGSVRKAHNGKSELQDGGRKP
jgi:hypothetical protein